MVQRVRASLLRGFPPGTTPHVLIACSGGRDSVVLTHLLQPLFRDGTITAGIGHVDHAARADSGDAATMVAAYAAELGMPVHIKRLQDNVLSGHPGAGAEEALRRERYLALAEMARKTGADVVALAHHQRDQAETVLLHLIRGAGLRGAAGMREWSLTDVPWWEPHTDPLTLRLWRPMLSEPAEEVASWHEQHGLPLFEDETNQDRRIRRNAIRHDVLPELEAIFPGATGNLARFADLAAEDDDLLESIAAEQVRSRQGEGLHRSVIVDEPPAIQRRVVQQWILRAVPGIELTSNRIDAVRNLAARNRSGTEVEIGGGWTVRIDRGLLSLGRR